MLEFNRTYRVFWYMEVNLSSTFHRLEEVGKVLVDPFNEVVKGACPLFLNILDLLLVVGHSLALVLLLLGQLTNILLSFVVLIHHLVQGIPNYSLL